MKIHSVLKIFFGVIVLLIGCVFVLIIVLLGLVGITGREEPSLEMVIGGSVYALIMTIIGRWVSDDQPLHFIYTGLTGLLPPVIIRLGWWILNAGLNSTELLESKKTGSS